MGACDHERFEVATDAIKLDSGPRRYVLEVKVRCAICHERFRFLGLPMGIDLKGACRDPDGLEARLAIHPQSETVPAGGPLGFSIRYHGEKKSGPPPT